MIVDCAEYRDGVRQEEAALGIAEAAERIGRERSFVWLGLRDPEAEEIEALSDRFGLHELAVEDVHHPHQRPKIEEYEGHYFIVLRTARYDDAAEVVEFGEIDVFAGPGYLIAVREGAASELKPARQRLEAQPALLRLGPAAATWAIVDKVVDDFEPVVEGLDNDIAEVEDMVFSQSGNATERIYFLKREVIEFHRAVAPLLPPLEAVERQTLLPVDPTLHKYFRDVADHARRIDEQLQAHRELLTSVLEANLALVSVRQNEAVRKISSWAAIIAVPTFLASVYGMNFEHMPELDWGAGYPLSLAAMALIVVLLFRFFKRIEWL